MHNTEEIRKLVAEYHAAMEGLEEASRALGRAVSEAKEVVTEKILKTTGLAHPRVEHHHSPSGNETWVFFIDGEPIYRVELKFQGTHYTVKTTKIRSKR